MSDMTINRELKISRLPVVEHVGYGWAQIEHQPSEEYLFIRLCEAVVVWCEIEKRSSESDGISYHYVPIKIKDLPKAEEPK